MRDRIPKYPGRVRLEPVAGQENTYDLVRADEATEPGTPVNKAALLTDETEVLLFGNAADRTVDAAFMGLANKIKLIMSDMAGLTVTVQDSAGRKISHVYIDGMFDENGNAVATDAAGVASGYVTEGNTTLRVANYGDIADYSETITAVKGQAYTKTITVTARNFLKLTSSRSVRFSGNVTRVDVTAVGGGGSGAAATFVVNSYYTGAPGGGGGYCAVQENAPFVPGVLFQAVVGAGGASVNNSVSAGNAGRPGGASSLLGVSANGGGGGRNMAPPNGGIGNGNGGASAPPSDAGDPSHYLANGQAGSVPGYSSFTDTVVYGGGGGGYDGIGAGYGGAGSTITSGAGVAGQDGYGGGGGGIYGYTRNEYIRNSGKGGSGCVAIRMHLAG